MPDSLKTTGDKLSFLIAEFKLQRHEIGELKDGQKKLECKVDSIDEKLRGNGQTGIVPRLTRVETEVTEHICKAEDLDKVKSSRKWELSLVIIAPIITAIITAFLIIHNIPK